MNINIDVEIFDDPEYCENDGVNCSHNGNNAVTDCERCLLFGEDLVTDYSSVLLIKCDECKKAYKIAKEFEDAKGKF